MAKPKIEEQRYFIVRRDELSSYGNEAGSDKAEAEELLSNSMCEDLVVIKGVIIKPYAKLD